MPIPKRFLPLLALVLVTLGHGMALAGTSLYRITISGMVCSFCAQGIEKRLKAVPGTESVKINLSKGMVEVTARPGSTLDSATLKKAVRDAGYDVRRIDGPVPASTAPAGKGN